MNSITLTKTPLITPTLKQYQNSSSQAQQSIQKIQTKWLFRCR